jgi:chitinase
MNWSKAKTIILKNKEVQNKLKMNEAEYKIIEEIIMARKEKNLTQKGLAGLVLVACAVFSGCPQADDSGPGTATVATPMASPAAGTYASALTVALSTATGGATIHYTTDGSTPTAGSALYASPISISATTTLKAFAVHDGMNSSGVLAAVYTINPGGETVATPTATPAGDNYPSAQTVTLATTTGGASIYYTTNGSTPTTGSALYASPITISTATTLKAVAVKSGMHDSGVLTAVYTFAGSGPRASAL